MNIKFNYMFRDEGNYKTFDAVVFRNPDKISLTEITEKIRENLISDEFFIANEWGIPDLYIGEEHGWCEFEDVESTDDAFSESLTITAFLKKIQKKPLY